MYIGVSCLKRKVSFPATPYTYVSKMSIKIDSRFNEYTHTFINVLT